MKNLIVILILVGSITSPSTGLGQDFGGGQTSDKGEAKTWNPFAKKTMETPRWSFPKFQPPKFDWLDRQKPAVESPMDYTTNRGPGMSRLFARPEGEPGLFENFNERSTEFWGRTTSGFSNWARETNAVMKARTFETWDNITKGIQRGLPGLPKPQAPKLQTPRFKFPPFRSAEKPTDQPKVRF